MTIYADIFRERIRLDLREQPFIASDVAELANWFRATPIAHPYGPGSYPPCPIPSYQRTCAGPPATLPPSEYVYRLTNVSSVIRTTNAKPRYRAAISSANFQRLQAAQRKSNRLWLPLSDYVIGVLPGRRDCTWWTPGELKWNPTLPSAHKIGMPNSWVIPTSLLLRIKRDDTFAKFLARVPTPIDAFESSVFLAATVPGARYGIAIDLSDPTDIRPGFPETVARDIPVELIETLPVPINPDERDRFPIEIMPILPALLSYYQRL